jgi:hypothetical protein
VSSQRQRVEEPAKNEAFDEAALLSGHPLFRELSPEIRNPLIRRPHRERRLGATFQSRSDGRSTALGYHGVRASEAEYRIDAIGVHAKPTESTISLIETRLRDRDHNLYCVFESTRMQ